MTPPATPAAHAQPGSPAQWATASQAEALALATVVPTPDGPFTFLTDDTAVLASGWTDDAEALATLIHASLRPAVTADPAEVSALVRGLAEQAAAAVRAYYDGGLDAPARIPVRQRSGEFRMQAWESLRQVPPGTTLTYTEYAAASGRPAAVRAAAGACALNAAALFVPCHRIVRTDGSLGGFRYGLPIKRSLLAREAPQEG